MIRIDDHPLLFARAFLTTLPSSLGELASPDSLTALLHEESEAPVARDEDVRKAVRSLLRHGGYKPTGRGKPASEYLVRAAGDGALSSINLAVDACNAVSLHSGLPISVVDMDLAKQPLHIGLAPEGTSYVFNASGQEIRVSGLLCLFDAEGPCANGVKDSQRTKTNDGTTRTLSVVWGSNAFTDLTDRATDWYMQLLKNAGAEVEIAPDATGSHGAQGFV